MSIGEKIGEINRFDQILNVLFKNEMGFLIEKLRLKDRLTLHQRLQKEKFKETTTKPEMLRRIFAELGGAFIKLAQFLSVRPDKIPLEYVKEFEKLQDRVPPVPFEEVKAIIESEFKKPLKDIFKEFEKEPVASASIAQVHKAKLLTGKEVAVKVQRTKINEIMKRDIDLMLSLALYMEKHNHTIKGINPVSIIQEFKKWTEKELDFEQEAANIKVFSINFMKDKNVIIPGIYEDYCTKKILTMEYIHGVELNNFEKVKEKGFDIDNVTKIGFNSILKQVFIDGFFHADPHPGNILIISNDKIAFVDFGIVGTFDEQLKENATNIFIGIIKNDPDMIIEALIGMGMDGKDTQIIKAEIEEKIKPLQGTELKDIIISKVLEDVLKILQRHEFDIPLDFVLFGKTVMTLEGIALKYDKEFRLTVQSKAFVERIIKKRKNPRQMMKNIADTTSRLKKFTISIPEKASNFMRNFKDANLNLKYIDRDMRGLIMELDKSSNRVTFGLIITALIIASTIMLSYDEIQIMNMSAFSFIGFILSAMLIIIVVISMLKERRF